jgi:hypothetical protein
MGERIVESLELRLGGGNVEKERRVARKPLQTGAEDFERLLVLLALVVESSESDIGLDDVRRRVDHFPVAGDRLLGSSRLPVAVRLVECPLSDFGDVLLSGSSEAAAGE